MSILNDAITDAAEMQQAAEPLPQPEPEFIPESAPAFNPFNVLRVKTGAGSISDYMDSPLNFNHSTATAQILRGVTGIAGELDLAVIDITIGVINLITERRKNAAASDT